MIFYVSVVTSLMSLLLNNFTSHIIPNLLLVHSDAIYWNKVSYILYRNIYVMKYCRDDYKLDEKSLNTH